MAVKIRLRRQGRKKKPYYHIVVADSRAPRDGKFIERIGSYDPTTIPATIELDDARALHWLKQGAIPTDTVRRILSYKGVLLRMHLYRWGKSEAEIEAEYQKWLAAKQAKIQAQIEKAQAKKEEKRTLRLAQEKAQRSEKEAKIQAKYQAASSENNQDAQNNDVAS
ncbi:MAG: 30S ribosomal protein S16 [Bacteroidia bacterium]|nr:30S ribosomal protein S16 [Bacteroidia bacterium]MDW8301700.1 30S ribosomal protein S16 [Bacteroidia bacterium]